MTTLKSQKIIISFFIIYGKFLQSLKSLKIIKPLPNSSLVMLPTPPGSLGDEALMMTTVQKLSSVHDKITIIEANANSYWSNYLKVSCPFSLDSLDLSGYLSGSKLVTIKSLFKAVNQAIRYDNLYLLGADMIDGSYSSSLSLKTIYFSYLMTKLGLKSKVLGFSFNASPSPGIIPLLKETASYVHYCIRDAVSFDRLVSQGISPLTLVADVAFLLEPNTTSETVINCSQWIKKQKELGHIILGFNPFNQLKPALKINTIEDLSNIYFQLISQLYNHFPNISFVFIPHDFRDYKNKPSEEKIISNLYQKLVTTFPEKLDHLYCLKSPLFANEIKGIVASLDLVISGKMHLCVACLGQKTPVVSISYQDKFEGLFQHFHLSDMFLEPELGLNPDIFSQFIISKINQRDSIFTQIKSALPAVQALTQKNFDSIPEN